jgi:hypothetical protein
MCLGPSSQQTSIASQGQALSQALSSDFNTTYANQASVLGDLTKSLSPIIAAGPSQNGLSPQAQAAQTTQALDTSGAENANLQRAVGNSFAGRGGGSSSGLISGIETQAKEQASAQSENQLASTLNTNTWNNYQLGNQNWKTALGAQEGVAGLENPNGLGSTAVGAGSSAYQEAETNADTASQTLASIAGAGVALGGDAAKIFAPAPGSNG